MRRLNIFTWHVHGSYLYYLSQLPHEFYLPIKLDRQEGQADEGYAGMTSSYPWPGNVHEVPTDEVRKRKFDCILHQSRQSYFVCKYNLFSKDQLKLPQVYLEHDPPREHPTDAVHPVDDPDVLLVHVTAFNRLMWDNRRTPTRVIDHGVLIPEGALYSGELPRGITVVNNLRKRGRRLGLDIFEMLRGHVPLDLVGMDSASLGGKGEIFHREIPSFESRYRFFFNPIRYTSLGLAICEAMMVGLPIVGLATTELVTVIRDGESGFLKTEPPSLLEPMRVLLNDLGFARKLGEKARQVALERFHIERFKREWNEALSFVCGKQPGSRSCAA